MKPQETTSDNGQYCENETGTRYGAGDGKRRGYKNSGYVELEVDVEIYSLSR